MTNNIQHVPVSLDGWHEEQQAWNNRSDFFVNMHHRADRVAQVTEFLAYVKDNHLIPTNNGKTLDIGCGVGDYTLGLARSGYNATGIDLSNGMIEGAKRLADEEQLSVNLYVGPWSEETRHTLGWNASFDLTYSIFCPVMFDIDNLKAMHKASKDKCLWLAFSERTDEMVDMLWEHFFGKDPFPWDGKMQECLDAIHDMGHHVKVEYKTVPETEVLELDKAIEYFTMRLHNDGWGSVESMKEEIRHMIEPFAIDGKIHNHTVDTVAWVSWSVNP